jgi:hypothetical protein
MGASEPRGKRERGPRKSVDQSQEISWEVGHLHDYMTVGRCRREGRKTWNGGDSSDKGFDMDEQDQKSVWWLRSDAIRMGVRRQGRTCGS